MTSVQKTHLSLALAGTLLTASCSHAQPNRPATPDTKPIVRIDLLTHGLPKDFFEPGADTKCAHQIIGYRFVVWLNAETVAVGFNTSPNCRPTPQQRVNGSARLVVFDVAAGKVKAQRDIPYLADGYGELVAEGEARPGPGGTVLFRIQSVNLDPEGRSESKSGVLLLDAELKDVAHLERFLEQTTFVNHALVFQEGFTFGNSRTYSVFDGVPLAQAKRLQQNWPIDARDRKFGERGVAFMVCQQELRPNEYKSTGIVYAGAKQRCTMTAQDDDGKTWSVPLEDGETASIVGLLADGSVVGKINVKGSNAGKLVIWKKERPSEKLPWIPAKYCGDIDGATPDMSRYAAFASDDCKDILSVIGLRESTTRPGHWVVFDRASQTPIADHPLLTNARAALSPNGLQYATFEAGELRIYRLPEPK